jgi:16S rRNA (cytosine967-C5)-methyltransferase
VSPARRVAFTVTRRVFEQGAYADRALAAEASGLEPRDRALAMQLSYGVVQRRATLDHVTERLAGRSPAKLSAPVLTAVRLGLLQLLFLDGIADHAAVNESVELAKAGGERGSKLVNAVLRRAARERSTLLDGLTDATPEDAAVLHSVPGWLAEKWWRELGAGEARALLARVNDPPESAIRVNTLATTVAEVAQRLPVSAHPAADLPEGLVLEGPFDLEGSELWREGAVMAQSRGSMLVARIVDPSPGERVLDLCAAPGGKTTHLAALLGCQGEIVAVEQRPGRAEGLERTCARMHASCVRVEVGDAARPRSGRQFERVLVDPPCSGLGTLQSRPDIRWRASPESIVELAELQRRILDAGAAATAPGGVLVYSVCTISAPEGAELIDEFLAEEPEFELERRVQLLPHRDGTDGFFVARLRRGLSKLSSRD